MSEAELELPGEGVGPAGARIGLALSGGGVRAMAFHTGVLRCLAEAQSLEKVAHISSVSGGTLLAGLLFALNDWKWPASAMFKDDIAPRIRGVLTQSSLAATATRLLLHPASWPYLFSRANILARAIEKCWGITVPLTALPRHPIWSINGTTAETGRRFRFKQDRCGDYELGYASASNFSAAEAMAVSAALPGVIGPLVLVTDRFQWFKRPGWGDPVESERAITLPYRRLHIYDGGIYDNLALEPLVDAGAHALKEGVSYVVCSDAGAPLPRISPGPSLSPFRAKRVLDLALDQSRALRIRSLSKLLQKGPPAGIYAQIGADPIQRIRSYQSQYPGRADELLKREWLSAGDIAAAANHPTTLACLSPDEFDRLERHGYESATWNARLFS
jgi:NTE family protein